MSTAKLNLWVSNQDDPCRMTQRRDTKTGQIWNYYFNIFNCDGGILEWCGRRYMNLQGTCGHLEVEVPPGCYRINACATAVSLVDPKNPTVYHGNWFTDSAIVQAYCGQETCVILFDPSLYRCEYILTYATRAAAERNVIPMDLATRVQQVLDELREALPKPDKQFELGYLDEIEKGIIEQEKKQ